MQLPRSWRVFSRNPGATFRIITDVDEALELLDTTDAQQQARMQSLGLEFNLNDGARGEILSRPRRSGPRRGLCHRVGVDVRRGDSCDGARHQAGTNFMFLRISNAGKRWSHCSPSRLIIERTMAALHEDGVRQFDLEHRQLCLQAPVRRGAVSADGCEHRARLAGNSLRSARSRRAGAAALSVARRTGRSARWANCHTTRNRMDLSAITETKLHFRRAG